MNSSLFIPETKQSSMLFSSSKQRNIEGERTLRNMKHVSRIMCIHAARGFDFAVRGQDVVCTLNGPHQTGLGAHTQ